jgi:reverse gyrase
MSIDASILPVMAGVMGSFVGASATVATAWITQRTLHKRDLFQAEMRKREVLYGEFIGECARLLVDAFIHTLDKPEKLLPIYALINRIRLCSSPAVLAEAEHLLRRIAEQYFAKNLTVENLREIARSEEADPLRAFAEACRVELKSIRTPV